MVLRPDPVVVPQQLAMHIQPDHGGVSGHQVPVPACLRPHRQEHLYGGDVGACRDAHDQISVGIVRRDLEADRDQGATPGQTLMTGPRMWMWSPRHCFAIGGRNSNNRP